MEEPPDDLKASGGLLAVFFQCFFQKQKPATIIAAMLQSPDTIKLPHPPIAGSSLFFRPFYRVFFLYVNPTVAVKPIRATQQTAIHAKTVQSPV